MEVEHERVVQRHVAGSEGCRFQFRFAVHVIWSHVPYLWTSYRALDPPHLTKAARSSLASVMTLARSVAAA